MRELRLHAGPDLHLAATRNAVAAQAAARLLQPQRAAGALPRLDAALDAALDADWASLWPRSCVVTGTERTSRRRMRILFRGRLRSVEFASRHILGNDHFERAPGAVGEPCDVLVVDHPLVGRFLSGSRAGMLVPGWLRQRSEIGADWPETLRALPASLRKEIARVLRRTGCTARVDANEDAKQRFYETLYVPYLTRRYGAQAIVPGRRAFRREADGAALLEAWAGGALLGATLLRRGEDGILAIGKAALSLEHECAGISDLLDYFSVLIAQLLGCRAVDFGLSRPHIDDGVLRYKAKWRARLVPAGGMTKAMRIVPLRASPSTLGFLSRNGFIERRGSRFLVRRLGTDAPEQAAAAQRAAPRQLDALAERPRQLDALAERPRQVDALAEPPPQLDALAERPRHLDALAERPRHLDALAERIGLDVAVLGDASPLSRPDAAAGADTAVRRPAPAPGANRVAAFLALE